MDSKRRNPENITENEMKKVKFPSCNKVQRKKSKGIPFVVTYHPLLKQLEGILRRNKYLLNMNAEVKQTFTPVPMVSYRSSRKLSSYLVRAKLYPIDRTVESKSCGKKQCEECVNVCETDTFSSTVNEEMFKINHNLNCDDMCLICLFMCECCGKQYAGETTGEFKFRGNNYKCDDRKYTRNEDCFQGHLFRHSHSGEHTGFLENVKITLIGKTDGQNPKKREYYWRRTLKIYAPFGLDVEDSVWHVLRILDAIHLLVSHLVSHPHLRYFFVATGKSFKWLAFTL